jgi:hypothetical protein
MPSDYAHMNSSQLQDEHDHVRIKISLLEDKKDRVEELLNAHEDLREIARIKIERTKLLPVPLTRKRIQS